MKEIIQELTNQFLDLLPNVLISLFVLVVGYLFAFLTKKLVIRLFNYLGRLGRQKYSHLNLTQAGAFLGSAFFWFVLLCSFLLITDILGLTILTNWFQSIIKYIPNVLLAILIIFGAFILGNLVSDFLKEFSKRIDIKYSPSLAGLARFLLLLVATIIALDQLGVEIDLLINIIGIVLAALLFGGALAFALGSKDSVSNILACYYLRKRYKEGDAIQVGKTKGVIIKIEATNVIIENEIGQVAIPAKIFNETECVLIKKI